MASKNLLKIFRVTHLYFGVFISPAILFFALTGTLQSFGLHETNRDHPDYKPARWMVVLGQLHKKQTIVVPERRLAPPARKDAATSGKPGDAPKGGTASSAPAAGAPAAAPTRKHNLLPMRIFFLVVCVGLFWSTLSGMYMAYVYMRNKKLVTLGWVLGILLPVGLLFL